MSTDAMNWNKLRQKESWYCLQYKIKPHETA